MQNFAELHLKPETLAQYGLPDIPYPVPATDLKSALLDNGDLPLAVMLHGLQQRSRDGEAEWQQVEPAMDRLAELLAPDDARDVISAAGDHWWLEVGPVDLGGKLVTIQRGDALIAAITARDDGRLRVAVFRPLDAKSAEYLIGLGQVPHPEHGVCMRENNWEYALDCSAGNGNYYAADRGEAYLSYWEKGLVWVQKPRLAYLAVSCTLMSSPMPFVMRRCSSSRWTTTMFARSSKPSRPSRTRRNSALQKTGTLFGDKNTKNVVLEKSYKEYMEGFTDVATGEAPRHHRPQGDAPRSSAATCPPHLGGRAGR